MLKDYSMMASKIRKNRQLRMMNKLLLVGMLLSAGQSRTAFAQTDWFTVVGDRLEPGTTTVEVSPTPVSIDGLQRVMKVRVNRAAVYLNSVGLAHRSYTSEVLFDCGKNNARFLSATFYAQPLWAGEPIKREVYEKSDNRFMRFRDIVPNPAKRILDAACQTTNARSGPRKPASKSG